jgi:hypothetical protein
MSTQHAVAAWIGPRRRVISTRPGAHLGLCVGLALAVICCAELSATGIGDGIGYAASWLAAGTVVAVCGRQGTAAFSAALVAGLIAVNLLMAGAAPALFAGHVALGALAYVVVAMHGALAGTVVRRARTMRARALLDPVVTGGLLVVIGAFAGLAWGALS